MGFLDRRNKFPRQAPAPSTPAPAQPPPGAGPERDLERPLLSLVYALRTWGQYEPRAGASPPEDEATESHGPSPFEHWARRVFAFSEGEAVDFDGLERFILKHRSEEQRAIERSVRDLREALWSFAECFSVSLNEDAAADERSRGSVDRLREAVVAGDIATIRREAVLTAQTVRSAISSRQQRQRTQIEQLAAKLEAVSSALVRAKREGETDALTGLFNRAALDAHMKRMTDLCVFMPKPPLLVVLDIDHFKWVNDRFGHDVGDLAIRSVASRLGASFRRGEDFLARFGGDEFVGVLDGVAAGTDMAQADRILFAIREIEIATPKEPLRVSCSVGLARARAGESAQDWFRRADDALYRAKRAGRDRAVSAEAVRAEAPTD